MMKGKGVNATRGRWLPHEMRGAYADCTALPLPPDPEAALYFGRR